MKTVFIFVVLSDKEGQTKRMDPTAAAGRKDTNRERAVRQQSSKRLEATMFGHYKALRRLPGGTFWEWWRNATRGAGSRRLMRPSRAREDEVRAVSTSKITCLENELERRCQVLKMSFKRHLKCPQVKGPDSQHKSTPTFL